MHVGRESLHLRVARALVVAAVLVFAAACGSAPAGPTQPSAGRETRDRVVQDYLAGLEQRDGLAIASLVSPRVDATEDIGRVLASDGGARLSDVTIALAGRVRRDIRRGYCQRDRAERGQARDQGSHRSRRWSLLSRSRRGDTERLGGRRRKPITVGCGSPVGWVGSAVSSETRLESQTSLFRVINRLCLTAADYH